MEKSDECWIYFGNSYLMKNGIMGNPEFLALAVIQLILSVEIKRLKTTKISRRVAESFGDRAGR